MLGEIFQFQFDPALALVLLTSLAKLNKGHQKHSFLLFWLKM